MAKIIINLTNSGTGELINEETGEKKPFKGIQMMAIMKTETGRNEFNGREAEKFSVSDDGFLLYR